TFVDFFFLGRAIAHTQETGFLIKINSIPSISLQKPGFYGRLINLNSASEFLQESYPNTTIA
ncbi:hypothetical protein, partial [Planktothrix sp.]|uniref:hypothetical protein n=1 Tax=Planktothrix sp. TaxID=3088171 RepID=UPI0038D470D0